MQQKLSHYTIITDPLNSRQDRVIFSTRSAQASIIKKNIYEALIEGRFEELDATDYDTMITNKVIVPADENELLEIITQNKEHIGSEEILYEVIQPSAMCQLGCDYCGQAHTKNYISNSLYDNLISRIREKAGRKKYRGMYIGWFGGEPLMGLKQIRELTPLLKELAAEFDMPYASKIVTNGLSLKENIFVELVNELKVDHIEVTLDGIAPYHDKRRITKYEGGATFNIIFQNLLDIFNRPDFFDFNCQISLRCNVDERNEDGVSPLIQLLAEHNLQEKIAYFYPIGVYSWAQNEAHKKSMTKEEFAEKEIGWLMELIEYGFNVNLLPGRVKQVCLSVSPSSEMYDAYGNIYNCTEVSYTPVYEGSDYVIGNLKFPKETYSKKRMLTDWNDEVLAGKFPCHTCKMLPVCGGACPKSWHEDMRACPPNKFNIKDKLTLSYIVSQKKLTEFAEA
jgi:uncharacterized protein